MKEVVWVFGVSAAGKQTFIKTVLSDKKLSKRFGWEQKTISACQESLDLLGDVGDKKMLEARKGILNLVPKLLQEADVVLIKWQYIDSANLTFQKLQEHLPKAKHRIILLEANLDEVKNRLLTKTWWEEKWNSTNFADNERGMVDKCMQQLPRNIEITTLDSSKSENYKLISRSKQSMK